MRKYIFISIVLVAASITAGDDFGRAGVFLSMPVGWRQIGTGGCDIAVGGEPISGWYNPSSIQGMKGLRINTGYSNLSLDRWFYYISGGWNINNDAAVALSWARADCENIPGRDISGNYTGELKYSDNAIFLTFSKTVLGPANEASSQIDLIAIGASLKYIQARLDDIETYIVGFDVGIYGNFFDDKLTVGLAYKNVGMKYLWESAEIYGTDHGSSSDEAIPPSIEVGAGFNLPWLPLTLTAEMDYSEYGGDSYRAGILTNPIEGASLAVGYDDGQMAFGAGYEYDLNFARIGLGYSLKFEREGLAPRHTLDINLGIE